MPRFTQCLGAGVSAWFGGRLRSKPNACMLEIAGFCPLPAARLIKTAPWEPASGPQRLAGLTLRTCTTRRLATLSACAAAHLRSLILKSNAGAVCASPTSVFSFLLGSSFPGWAAPW